MKIICLSSIEDTAFIQQSLLTEKLSTADGNYNYRLIKGIDANNDSKCVLFNYVPVGSYPLYKKIILKSSAWKKDKRTGSINVGFINISGLKQISLVINYICHLKAILSTSQEPVYIICYDLFLPFLLTISHLKRRFPTLIACLVIPSIPEYDFVRNWKERINCKLSRYRMKMASIFNCFVFLTEQMKEKIPTNNYVVIEGISPEINKNTSYCSYHKSPKDHFKIAYTGRLDKLYHIDDLIEAVQKIKQYDLELILCGNGDLVKWIKDIASFDRRIKYLGFLDAESISKLQSEVDVLINTRSPEGEYTKFSFPSKTMEYLASGTPVLMHRLPGIPIEYDKYLNYFNGSDINSIITGIEYVIEGCISGEAIAKALHAREFIMYYKTPEKQGKKVINLFEGQ